MEAMSLAACLAAAEVEAAFVDRFEGDRAVLLAGGRTCEVPRGELGRGAREGDVVGRCGVDRAATARAREALERARARVPWRDR